MIFLVWGLIRVLGARKFLQGTFDSGLGRKVKTWVLQKAVSMFLCVPVLCLSDCFFQSFVFCVGVGEGVGRCF